MSTRIINRTGGNTLAAIVNRVPHGVVAIRPGAEALEPRIIGFFLVEDNHTNSTTIQSVAPDQIIPFALNDFRHQLPQRTSLYAKYMAETTAANNITGSTADYSGGEGRDRAGRK